MIDKALFFLRQEINTYLKLKTGDDNKITLSAIVSQTGTEVAPHNSVGMMLVNVEEEKAYRQPNPQTVSKNGYYSFQNPELTLNLYMVVYANHSDHREALVLLSYIVQFFQAKNVFDNQESPQLGEDIEKLVVDLYSLTFEQQNQLWASLGAKYLPSVVYKVRMVVVNEKQPLAVAPAVSGINTGYAGRE
ncbi:MAG: DUF4255 domain-containing protein [Bacteroidota bacterium]|nr:DUF4255 domain-containing protein [Bacteroidota bacterium]